MTISGQGPMVMVRGPGLNTPDFGMAGPLRDAVTGLRRFRSCLLAGSPESSEKRLRTTPEAT